MENNLPYPFNRAFEDRNSIDYKVTPGSKQGTDHEYVRKLGYEPEMYGDCTYGAKDLPGFSLSSYGDWGTFYVDWATDKGKEMFLDMYEKGIIKLWRIRKYVSKILPISKEKIVFCFDYTEDGGWKKYNGEKWIDNAEDPYKEVKWEF